MPSTSNISRASDFMQSIGVNTHINWKEPGLSWNDFGVVQRSLAYLGATHVRDSVPVEGWSFPDFVTLAKAGIKFDLLATSPNLQTASDIARMAKLETTVPSSVAAIEGPNEYNWGPNALGGPAWIQTYGPELWNAVKGNPVLANKEVIAASLVTFGPAEVAEMGNVAAFSDSANWHTYFGQGDQPGRQLVTNNALARSSSPGEKLSITETGYYTAVDAMDWGGGGVTPAVQAILTVNILLDAYKQGVETTYIYELLDNIADPASTDIEGSFGLFLADGTPKPAATAVHNLTAILADKGAAAATFTPGTLNATVTGLPSTGSTMTLQKSSGAFDIVVWDEPDVWNQPTKSAINPGSKPVTVALGATYASVKVYDPLSGTTPVQTLTNVDKVELSLGSHPYIIEVPGTPGTSTPQPLPPPPTPTPTPGNTNTLVLKLSEDA